MEAILSRPQCLKTGMPIPRQDMPPPPPPPGGYICTSRPATNPSFPSLFSGFAWPQYVLQCQQDRRWNADKPSATLDP